MPAIAHNIVEIVRQPFLLFDGLLGRQFANPGFFSEIKGHEFSELDGGAWNESLAGPR